MGAQPHHVGPGVRPLTAEALHSDRSRALLSRVEPLLRSAIDLKSDLEQAQGELMEYRERVALMGGVNLDRGRVSAVRTRSETAACHLRAAIEQVQDLGCVIKDLDTGLVDFPTCCAAMKCTCAGGWARLASASGTAC